MNLQEEDADMGFYAVIPSMILDRKDICAGCKLFYARITSLARKQGFCWATDKSLAKMEGKSERTISQWISDLRRIGFINTINIKKENVRKIYLTFPSFDHGNNDDNDGSKPSVPGGGTAENCDRGTAESCGTGTAENCGHISNNVIKNKTIREFSSDEEKRNANAVSQESNDFLPGFETNKKQNDSLEVKKKTKMDQETWGRYFKMLKQVFPKAKMDGRILSNGIRKFHSAYGIEKLEYLLKQVQESDYLMARNGHTGISNRPVVASWLFSKCYKKGGYNFDRVLEGDFKNENWQWLVNKLKIESGEVDAPVSYRMEDMIKVYVLSNDVGEKEIPRQQIAETQQEAQLKGMRYYKAYDEGKESRNSFSGSLEVWDWEIDKAYFEPLPIAQTN